MTKKKLNAADEVKNFLGDNPDIRMVMRRGLINTTSLARYIIKENNLDVTLDAVTSAIRRYELDTNINVFENALKWLRQTGSITTRNKIASVAVFKDDEIQKILPQLFSMINYSQGDTLRIIQADKSIKIFIDEKNLERVKKLFLKEKIKNIEKKLAEINIHMHKDSRDVPGIAGVIGNKLAENGISIKESIGCFPESLWFVDQKEILKIYKVMCELCEI